VRQATNVIYFDNITFSVQPGLVMPDIVAPKPTLAKDAVISMFSNAYTNVPVNTWLTEWSVASLTDVQSEVNDAKRYAYLDFAGMKPWVKTLLMQVRCNIFTWISGHQHGNLSDETGRFW